ncbi:hypothetical protein BZA70DRAFT_280281 [Myxozyma melibiosi]|uniref:Nuclear segregation protein n=1 Tax=Myxozyma melibiosi TaxID=54550 RepID=A0ABR1F522_9ASCO
MAAVEDPKKTDSRVRPTKPDQTAFESGLDALEKELKAKNEKQEYYQHQLKALSTDSPQNEKQQELRASLNAIKQRQAEIRAANGKVFDEIKALDEDIRRKIKDVQAAKSKLNFKSADDLDAYIKKLESQVDSGTLKLVEEKRLLSDITSLKKARKTFSSIREIEQSIAESKEKVAALRSSIEDTESKELSAKHSAITTELNAIRAETDKVYKNRSSLVEKLNEARKAREEAYNNLRKFKNEFYQQKREFGKYEQEERQRRWERQKAEREAVERERRKKRAAQKLESASEPAFENDIKQAESLLQYFDPTFKPSSGDLTGAGAADLAAQAKRSVEAAPPPGTQVLSRKPVEEEVYFVAKKGKKKSGNAAQADKEKFTLNLEIVSSLSKLSIGVPMNKEEVPATVESLREKITWFYDNQERVTAENIKKAEAEIERLEKEAESEGAKKSEKRSNKQNGKAENGEAEASPEVTETAAAAEESTPAAE